MDDGGSPTRDVHGNFVTVTTPYGHYERARELIRAEVHNDTTRLLAAMEADNRILMAQIEQQRSLIIKLESRWIKPSLQDWHLEFADKLNALCAAYKCHLETDEDSIGLVLREGERPVHPVTELDSARVILFED